MRVGTSLATMTAAMMALGTPALAAGASTVPASAASKLSLQNVRAATPVAQRSKLAGTSTTVVSIIAGLAVIIGAVVLLDEKSDSN